MCALFAAAPRQGCAQGTLSKEGALFLLVPVGARAVGMGQAVVASQPGSEGLWWNPASMARIDKTEFSLDHSQTVVATGDALSIVKPAGRAGVISGAAYLVDYGQQDATDQGGAIGTLLPRSVVLAASYAAPFGARVNAGLTYKFVQSRLDCTGSCGNVATFNVSTSAFDAGMQVVVDSAGRLVLGIAVRNLGLRLQMNDNAQADPLPTRIHAGAQYLVPGVEHSVPGGELRVTAEIVGNSTFASPSLRAGGEFVYKQQYSLRAGFVSGSGDAAGAAIGLGFQRRGIGMDFARAFGGFSSDAGKPPTYLTLRLRF